MEDKVDVVNATCRIGGEFGPVQDPPSLDAGPQVPSLAHADILLNEDRLLGGHVSSVEDPVLAPLRLSLEAIHDQVLLLDLGGLELLNRCSRCTQRMLKMYSVVPPSVPDGTMGVDVNRRLDHRHPAWSTTDMLPVVASFSSPSAPPQGVPAAVGVLC
jgi:hypothetical protein